MHSRRITVAVWRMVRVQMGSRETEQELLYCRVQVLSTFRFTLSGFESGSVAHYVTSFFLRFFVS